MEKVVRVEVRQGSTMWTEDCHSFDEVLEAMTANPYNSAKNNVKVWFDTEYIGEFDYWLADGELYTASELNEECDELADIRNYFKETIMKKLTYKGAVRGCKYYADKSGTYYLFIRSTDWYYNQGALSPILAIVTDRIQGIQGEFWKLEYNIL